MKSLDNYHLLRTRILLDNINSKQMNISARKGMDILMEEGFLQKEEKSFASIGQKRTKGKKSQKISYHKPCLEKIINDTATKLGLASVRELFAGLGSSDKNVVYMIMQRIQDQSVERGMTFLESDTNGIGLDGIDLDDNKVLERLRKMFDDPDVRSVSYDPSVKIKSLRDFFIEIGKGNIKTKIVKEKLSEAGKRFKMPKQDPCGSAA